MNSVQRLDCYSQALRNATYRAHGFDDGIKTMTIPAAVWLWSHEMSETETWRKEGRMGPDQCSGNTKAVAGRLHSM